MRAARGKFSNLLQSTRSTSHVQLPYLLIYDSFFTSITKPNNGHGQVLHSHFQRSQLTQAKSLFLGNTLISVDGDFALGFFSPTSSNKSLYIGIWYHNIPERNVVWVANGDNKPITTPSAQLAITNSLELVLSDGADRTLWRTTANNATSGVVVHVLLCPPSVKRHSGMTKL